MQVNYRLLMKKSLVIVFAVALLGAIGTYNSSHSATASPSPKPLTRPSNKPTTSTQTSTTASARYKDGNYVGSVAETPYGDVQVMVTISGGRITDVHFTQMPNDQPHSVEVTRDSEPLLLQSTLAKQSADVDFVSGATSTVYGYKESLQAALDRAAAGSYISPQQYSSV